MPRLRLPRLGLRRFVVSGASMEPTYRHGDLLVAVPRRRVSIGECRVFEHPTRPGMWLVKRVVSLDGTGMWVLSDNPEATRADSRTFGHLPVSGSYRVVGRLRRRPSG